jgi:predicted nucleic acid-binding protein
MPGKALILDANIVIRAVLGRRVREVIERYAEEVSFFVPEPAYTEAMKHLTAVVQKRGGDPDDWPVLAAALAIGCPIWTEDADFFGCGVATWTSSRIRMFLREG